MLPLYSKVISKKDFLVSCRQHMEWLRTTNHQPQKCMWGQVEIINVTMWFFTRWTENERVVSKSTVTMEVITNEQYLNLNLFVFIFFINLDISGHHWSHLIFHAFFCLSIILTTNGTSDISIQCSHTIMLTTHWQLKGNKLYIWLIGLSTSTLTGALKTAGTANTSCWFENIKLLLKIQLHSLVVS